MPESADRGARLRTAGLPFCVSGVGDLLALFRCISCRYTFSLDLGRPELLGAPGRVVFTGEVRASRVLRGHGSRHGSQRQLRVLVPQGHYCGL